MLLFGLHIIVMKCITSHQSVAFALHAYVHVFIMLLQG